jgi:Gpi18-like mannosyltransferase
MVKLKNLFSKHDWIYLGCFLLISLALRMYFLSKPGYDFDINLFLKWGTTINQHGLNFLYNSKSIFINYPPLIPLITALWLKIGSLLSAQNLSVYFRILPTIFELILLIICSFYILKSQQKYKYFLLFIVLIQPGLALITSAWGQIDSILSLLIILAFIFQGKYPIWSVIFLALSILIKPQAIIAVILYFLILIFAKKWLSLLTSFLLFLIFILLYAFSLKLFANVDFFQPYFSALGSFTNISLNAFNVWWLIFSNNSWNIPDTTRWIISYKLIGLILFAIFSLPALFYLRKRKTNLPENLLVLSYFYLMFFVFPTEIHERYLYYSLAFLAIPAILNWKIFAIYIILTVTLFFNCYFVLQAVYPQFSYLHGNFLGTIYPVIISYINVIIAIYLAFYFIYEAIKSSKQKKIYSISINYFRSSFIGDSLAFFILKLSPLAPRRGDVGVFCLGFG